MTNDLPGNPYFSDHLLDSPDERSVPVMLAALAHEVRTANLIALWCEQSPELKGVDYTPVQAEIKERLALPQLPPPEPVQHYRTGPGKCNCGFNAYQLRGIMLDYGEELYDHIRANGGRP